MDWLHESLFTVSAIAMLFMLARLKRINICSFLVLIPVRALPCQCPASFEIPLTGKTPRMTMAVTAQKRMPGILIILAAVLNLLCLC